MECFQKYAWDFGTFDSVHWNCTGFFGVFFFLSFQPLIAVEILIRARALMITINFLTSVKNMAAMGPPLPPRVYRQSSH